MGLTRTEFLSRLGMLKVVDPMVDSAYEQWGIADALGDDVHSSGKEWHTAFHSSQFPGDSPYACGRQLVYGLMGLPRDPFDRRGQMYMDAGKNLELELVRRIGRAGWLMSAEAGDTQTVFEDHESILSGSPDILVLPFGWDRAHVVEVKGKGQRRSPPYRAHQDPVAQMQRLEEEADPKHVRQLKAYIGQANLDFHKRVPYVVVCNDTWRVLAQGTDAGIASDASCPIHDGLCLRLIQMKPVVDGTLYYVALDDGTVTHEYFHSLDRRWFDAGRERLRGWKEMYLRGELPQRPDDFMWSKDPYPCRFCPLKKDICKPDDKAGITKLEDSNAIAVGESIRPDYDYRSQRAKVLDRWGLTDQEVTNDG